MPRTSAEIVELFRHESIELSSKAGKPQPQSLKSGITRSRIRLTHKSAHKFLIEDSQAEKMSSLTTDEAQRHQRHTSEKQPNLNHVSLKRTFTTNPTCRSLVNMLRTHRTGSRMILTHALVSLIVIALAIGSTNVRCQESLGPDSNLPPDSSQALPDSDTALLLHLQQQQQQQQQQPQPKQFEISTPPNKQVELECKLPQLVLAQSNETNSANFYWLFQRISDHKTKPEQLCLGSRCFNGRRRGIELEFDRATGAYNLLIRNATYKDNDGIYYCEYQDTQSDASHSTEIQLTILSK